jgi:hypothetical protein
MPTELSHPSIYRENALNALIEIRACYGEVRTFVAGAFDRLNDLIEELGTPRATRGQAGGRAECEAMQDQIDRLVQLAHELASSVADHIQRPGDDDRARPEEAGR